MNLSARDARQPRGRFRRSPAARQSSCRPTTKPAFEVATIKPTSPGRAGARPCCSGRGGGNLFHHYEFEPRPISSPSRTVLHAAAGDRRDPPGSSPRSSTSQREARPCRRCRAGPQLRTMVQQTPGRPIPARLPSRQEGAFRCTRLTVCQDRDRSWTKTGSAPRVSSPVSAAADPAASASATPRWQNSPSFLQGRTRGTPGRRSDRSVRAATTSPCKWTPDSAQFSRPGPRRPARRREPRRPAGSLRRDAAATRLMNATPCAGVIGGEALGIAPAAWTVKVQGALRMERSKGCRQPAEA